MREGWELKKLKEVCQIRPPKREVKKNLSDTDLVSFVPMNILGIEQKYFNYKEDKKLSEVSSSYTYFQDGDVLLAKITPCFENGKLGIAKGLTNKVGFGSSEFIVYRPLETLHNEYLYYYLNQEGFRNKGKLKMTGAVGHKRISKEFYEESLIPTPPLSEQKQIIAILDKAFAAIDQAKANIEKNIENAKELFDSEKDKLFKKLELENKVQPLLEACEKMFAGGDKPKEHFSKGKTNKYDIPIVSNGEKNNGLYGFTNEAKVTKPSITISARGTIGYTVYRDYPFVPIVRLIVLTPKIDVVQPEYLMHAVKNLNILRSGSSIPQLTVPMMKSYSIPIPPLEKQYQIVKTLNKLDSKLIEYNTRLNQKLIELQELKKSILQKAFAGELSEKEVVI